MKNNCVIDIKREILIPQNKVKKFEIIKSKDWSNSIDILIDTKEEIDILNLFIILKSYVKSIEFYCFKVCIILKKEKNDTIVLENVLINFINKFNFLEFESWFIKKLTDDEKYINNKEDLYGFRLSFQEKIIRGLEKKYNIKDIENFIKPIYPWKKEIIKEYKLEINEIDKLKEKIKYLEKKLKNTPYSE